MAELTGGPVTRVEELPNGTFMVRVFNLTKEQVALLRCHLQADPDMDPVHDWGFDKHVDNDFIFEAADMLEHKGF